MWIAEEMLRAEGFEDVSYVPLSLEQYATVGDVGTVGAGGADITITDIFAILPALDAGKQVVALAGIHGGCYELFGAKRDLKGKTVVCEKFLSGDHILLSSMLAWAGLNPNDVKWLSRPGASAMNAFIDGQADAFLAFPPEPQELRARKIGRVLLNTSTDRPWSQYYCCMVGANRDYVQRNPIATKHVLRAILKATTSARRHRSRPPATCAITATSRATTSGSKH